MTGLEIGAIIAAIVGAAMQTSASYTANKRAQAALQDAMWQLNEDGKKINEKIVEGAGEFEHDKRAVQQQDIAKQVSDEIKSNVAESQTMRDESQTVQGNVSDDYTQARSASQALTADKASAFADLVGKIRSAAQLRQNEGFGLMKTGQEVDKLARNARGNWQVGQARVDDAAHSRDGLKAAGQLVSALGSIMGMGAMGQAMSAGASAGSAASGSVGQVAPYGFTGADQTMNAFGATWI